MKTSSQRVNTRTPRADHGHHLAVRFRHVRDRCMESDLALVLGLEGRELGAAGAVGAAAEEPRFYYIGERGGRHVSI